MKSHILALFYTFIWLGLFGLAFMSLFYYGQVVVENEALREQFLQKERFVINGIYSVNGEDYTLAGMNQEKDELFIRFEKR